MSDYELGVFWAAIIWLLETSRLFLSLNSQLNRNLRKVGCRVRWAGGQPRMMEQDEINPTRNKVIIKSSLYLLWGLISIALSWLFVIYSMVRWVKSFYSYNFGAPEVIKIQRFKMNNIDMSFDEILKLMYDVEVFLGSKMKDNKFLDYKKRHIEKMKLFGTEELIDKIS